jgi:hypothetical protein
MFMEVSDHDQTEKAIRDALHTLSSNFACVLAGGAGATQSLCEHLPAYLSERGGRVAR